MSLGSAISSSLPNTDSCTSKTSDGTSPHFRGSTSSPSTGVGQRYSSLLLPIWLEKDWDRWSTFGGGGCAIHHGRDSQNYCLAGWALARQVLPSLQLGAELVHQTPDSRGARTSTAIGAGLHYDLSMTYHLLAYAGVGLKTRAWPTDTHGTHPCS